MILYCWLDTISFSIFKCTTVGFMTYRFCVIYLLFFYFLTPKQNKEKQEESVLIRNETLTRTYIRHLN